MSPLEAHKYSYPKVVPANTPPQISGNEAFAWTQQVPHPQKQQIVQPVSEQPSTSSFEQPVSMQPEYVATGAGNVATSQNVQVT